MKDNRFGVEDVVGFVILAVVALAVVWMVVVASGGPGDKEANYSATGTHCEEHEGYMGQVVVTCDRD